MGNSIDSAEVFSKKTACAFGVVRVVSNAAEAVGESLAEAVVVKTG